MNIDADGNFIKTTLNEKGTTIIWTWDAEKNAWYTPFFKGFIWDRATEDNKYFSDQLHMSVLIDESIKGFPTITHHDNIDPPNTKNWTSLFQNQLFLQMVDDGMFPNKQSIDLGPWYDNSHKFRRDFTNADGPQRIILTDGLKIALHIRGDFVALKANMETNGFSLLPSVQSYGPANDYMIKIWSNQAGSILYADIAPSLQDATKWTKRQIYEIFLLPFTAVMTQAPDLSHPTQSQFLDILVVTASNSSTSQLFDFGPPQ